MQYVTIALTALFSMVVLFCVTRLTGSRQISSMSVYEYVNSITLGSLAAQLAVAQGEDFPIMLIGTAVYGLITALCAYLTNKSRTLRRFLVGKPLVLMEHGQMNRRNFARARMDVEEFCAHLRSQGYFDLSRVDSAVMETTGRVSVLSRAADRPVSPKDMKLPVSAERLCRIFVVDGQLISDALRAAGRSEAWLREQMTQKGISGLSHVFLCCESANGDAWFFGGDDVKTGGSV